MASVGPETPPSWRVLETTGALLEVPAGPRAPVLSSRADSRGWGPVLPAPTSSRHTRPQESVPDFLHLPVTSAAVLGPIPLPQTERELPSSGDGLQTPPRESPDVGGLLPAPHHRPGPRESWAWGNPGLQRPTEPLPTAVPVAVEKPPWFPVGLLSLLLVTVVAQGVPVVSRYRGSLRVHFSDGYAGRLLPESTLGPGPGSRSREAFTSLGPRGCAPGEGGGEARQAGWSGSRGPRVGAPSCLVPLEWGARPLDLSAGACPTPAAAGPRMAACRRLPSDPLEGRGHVPCSDPGSPHPCLPPATSRPHDVAPFAGTSRPGGSASARPVSAPPDCKL